jgi:hypothetical protein
MKAIRTDNLTKMFGQLVVLDHTSFDWVLTFSRRWKLTSSECNSDLNEVPLTV